MDVLFFLLISSMMISSGGGDNFTMETKYCSVLPYRPKCFEPIKDFRIGQSEIEVYNRPKTVATLNTGVSSGVKVSGVTNGIRIGTHKMTVTCTKDSDYNDARHGTKFWAKNEKTWRIWEDLWENNNELKAKDLVITTRREKWTCGKGNTKFYRMVSEHLTTKIIGEVNFPDNTFIHKIPIPRLRFDEEQKYRAVIREIKYTNFDLNSGMFDGRFLDQDGTMAEENRGDFIKLEVIGGIARLSDRSKRIIYKRKLLIDELEEAFTNKNSIARCDEINLDSSRANSKLFGIFPEWSYSKDNGQSFTCIEKSNFLEKFIITKYQMMKCRIGEGESASNIFYRVEIEYLFTGYVDEVHVTETIDDIYKFKLPGSSTERSFGIVENFDFNPENPTEAFKFAGQVRIIK